MELTDPLIKECLCLGRIGRNGKGDIACGAHEISGLSGPLVECFAVLRMASVNGIFYSSTTSSKE